ncbi:MAG TPA: phosphodiester glycosidase family protein [Chitinophagaceae bacterium]|nr:phosphodiester glycosidase family protein [Chitinophagaceae bacterium]
MKRNSLVVLSITVAILAAGSIAFTQKNPADDAMISYTVDPKTRDLRFYWKDDSGHVLGSIQRLKDYLGRRHQKLVFAMNGGMYQQDNSPLGLFIREQRTITKLNTSAGEGNFYLKPNGVLYISRDNKAVICPTDGFINNGQVKFATQSGPMLLIDGAIHPAFKKGSANVNIRNGVGLLPGNKLVFAMSKSPINFYDFADYFKSLGCRDALYLDGFVSRTYLPEKSWLQMDGDFGVLIGVTIPEK